MNAEERIAQLTAERAGGAVIAVPRRPAVRAQINGNEYHEPAPVDPLAGRCLPESWRKIPDEWKTRDRLAAALNLETRIAAWAIARCLGEDWRAEPVDWNNRSRVEVVHRDGYGFSFGRSWRDNGRFRITPLRRHRRDEGPPEEITVAASRTFGSIAADIQRRMIDAGLQDEHDKSVAAEQERRTEIAERFSGLNGVVRAAGGWYLNKLRWQSDCYPMIEIPGGTAAWSYGDRVRIEVDLTPEQAADVGETLKRLREEAK
jgi:hypothetical protein